MWGASGGKGGWPNSSGNYDHAGKGGYTSGIISLSKTNIFYIYIGQLGINASNSSTPGAYAGNSWNGGGSGRTDTTPNDSGGSGGGATDIRLSSGAWNSALSLNSRIMVAGAGGGTGVCHLGEDGIIRAGSGGGLRGVGNVCHWQDSIVDATAYSGTQVSGYNFGIGEDGVPGGEGGAGGGGGYYGGLKYVYGNANANPGSGGGGSSYISGHTGSVAIAEGSTSNPRAVKISGCTTGTTNNACSIHYSGKYFTNTLMIDGAGYKWTNTKQGLQQMPNPNGGYYASGVGHSGNGAARITYLGTVI